MRTALLVALALPCAARAETETPPDAARIEDAATRAEGAIRSGGVELHTLEALRAELAGLRDALAAADARGDVAVRALRAELAELPPPPPAGETEPARIAAERVRLAEAVAEADAPLLAGRLALARLRVLIADLDRQSRARTRAEILGRGPSPLWPETLAKGASGIAAEGARLRQGFAADAALPSRQDWLRTALVMLAVLVPLSVLGWFIGLPALMRRVEAGERAPDGRPRRARVALSLVLRAVAAYLLAAIGAAGLAAPFLRPAGMPETASELVVLPVILMAAHWLAHALFAPDAPHRRIIALTGAEARRATRLVQGLGLVVVLEMFAEAAEVEGRLGAEGNALVALVLLATAAALLWALARSLLAADGAARSHDLRRVLAQALRAVAVAAVVAAVLGYSALGRAMIDPCLISLWLIGMTIVVQRAILLAARGLTGAVRPESDATGASVALTAIAVGTALGLLSLPLHALLWGARLSDLRDGFRLLRDGIDLGGTRLSLGGVVVLVGVFALGVVLTRWVQKLLRFDVLPNTRIDRGGQSAIVTGFGYAGILVSALVAITMAGINLASLAIVAGALSVGIGFGLQAIVSNFVSGIILLVERPIKEGDWIEVKGHSGTVRKISVRSTRLETFDGHDVIVPNADLVTGSVRNMTLGSLSGRIDLPVGVAYGSDLDLVRETLLGLARAHPMVLAHPEPVVFLMKPGDSSVELELRCFVRDIGKGVPVRSDLYFSILRSFAETGVIIPFPVRDLRVTAVPSP
ncbi:mechanosensitive ion channel domain-containing protein [Paragemmobacter straminiformis]|uniref:Mechanosensitive ion channel n=1 Tax=Paragemmobacter straminiformis TaxID=2045119 RepID=A0A842I4X9_9RHOB|nr:mechanosensitive ion channel domain-containing protein [Gemmobacter straminiformis]MBC2834669.1 mechanosensitive ion channel [Gemmobacter straminiformis]